MFFLVQFLDDDATHLDVAVVVLRRILKFCHVTFVNLCGEKKSSRKRRAAPDDTLSPSRTLRKTPKIGNHRWHFILCVWDS